MNEDLPAAGIIDTSVVVDLDRLTADALPGRPVISAITLAELAIGPHATTDPQERARRQDRLQRAEALLEVLPFDAPAARAYGLVFAAVSARGRKARGTRALDLLIAATALANRLPLYTRNPDDLRHLEDLVDIVPVHLA